MSTSTGQSADLRQLVEEVHRHVGRCLLRFEEIELSLKIALPYIHPAGSKDSLEALHSYQKKVSSMTLGQLFGQVRECPDYPAVVTETFITETLEARNLLIHGFYQTHADALRSIDGLHGILDWLQATYDRAGPLWDFCRAQGMVVLLAISADQTPLGEEIRRDRNKLIAVAPAGFEFVCTTDPTQTLWETTRIVELLKEAEEKTEKVEGLTLLSRAGAYIRQADPELQYRDYGLGRLQDLIHASGLFDIFEVRAADGRSPGYAYRSKR